MKKTYKPAERRLQSLNPRKLTEARVARGLSMVDFASRIGVTRQAVSQWERGETQPTGSTLARLIQELKFPLSFFTYSAADRDVPTGPLFFRSLQSKTRRDQDLLGVRVQWISRLYDYLNKFVNFPSVDVDPVDRPDEGETLSDDDIEEIASNLRKKWSLGMGPIRDVALLLEKRGVVVTQFPFQCEKMDAFSQWREGRPFVYLRSDNTTAVRNRLNGVHELGHLALHSHVDYADLANPSLFKCVENEAFRFAGAFLLPSETFGSEVFSSSLDHFIELKKRWKVSVGAMIMRCETLGLLSDRQVLYLRQQMNKRRIRTWEPLDDKISLEVPRVVSQAIKLLIDRRVQTPAQIVDALSIYPEEFESLCSLERGVLSVESSVIPISIKGVDRANGGTLES